MIYKYLIGFLLLIALKSFSQSSDIKILHKEKAIGENLLTQTEIRATEYLFPDRIHHSHIDTSSGLLTIQLRGLSKNGKRLKTIGKIVLYDINNKKVKWTKKMLYHTSHLQQFNNTLIHTVEKKSFCLNIENGENQWELKNNIYFVDPINNIGLGYKYKNSTGYTNTLEGVDLSNGNVIWQKKLNREYGWNDIFYINDSTLIVVAAGLHAINIKNGTGWDYNTITGEKDYTGTVAANALGVVAGLLTGAFVMSTGHNLVRDVVSNVLIDSTDIYFASKERLARINKSNGIVVWTHPIPNDLASKSSIFMKNSSIYMINKGHAFMGYRHLDFGTPFIAAFDKETGKRKFFSIINTKKDPILGFQIHYDTIYIVFKERISKYSIIDGTQIYKKTYNTEETGELMYFVGNHVYIKSKDSTLTSLPLLDTNKIYVFTNTGKTLVLDNQLEITDRIDYDRLYIYYLSTKYNKFIAKGSETTILDIENREIAKLNATSDATLIGNKLYDIQEKSFLEIDLSEIIENE